MGNLYAVRDWKINSLSLENETKLQTNIITASELRIAESPRGICSSGNVMQLQIDNSIVIAVVICRDVSLLYVTNRVIIGYRAARGQCEGKQQQNALGWGKKLQRARC